MHHVIKGGSAFASLRVELAPGDTVKATRNAMMAMSGELQLGARMDGGILRSIARKFTGESFFFQNISAGEEPGWVMLAPPMPGAITAIELHGRNSLIAEKSTFLAATASVEISGTLQQPFKALLSGTSFAAVKVTGPGIAFLCGFGAIEPVTLIPDQEITVNTGHLIAWDESVTYSPGRGGRSWSAAVLGGSGLVARVKGPGRVWVQTRTMDGFKEWLGALLPQEEKSVKSGE